jgi:O-antigen/teichoic acid export membrane protein
MRRGVIGQLTALLFTSLVFSIVYVSITFRYIKAGLNFSYLRKYLAFGLPVIPSGLSIWLLSMSSSLILLHMTSLHEVGLFALGVKFGIILDVLAVAVMTAWEPFFYNKASTDKGPELLSQVGTYFVFIILGLAVAVLLGARSLLHIATTPKFFDAERVVGFVVVGNIIRSLYLFNVQGIAFKMKTKYFPLIDGAAAIICVGCGLLLIPKYRMIGAALSIMIGYLFQFLCTFFISIRLYPIPYQYGRLVKIVLIYSVVLWSLFCVEFNSDLLTLVIRIVLLPILVIVGLILLHVPEEREKQKVLEFLRREAIR